MTRAPSSTATQLRFFLDPESNDQSTFGQKTDMAVGQNQWYHFWGRCTNHFRTFFSGDCDGHIGAAGPCDLSSPQGDLLDIGSRARRDVLLETHGVSGSVKPTKELLDLFRALGPLSLPFLVGRVPRLK